MTAPEVFQVRDGDGWEVYVTNPAGGWWLLASVGGTAIVDTLPDGAEEMVSGAEYEREMETVERVKDAIAYGGHDYFTDCRPGEVYVPIYDIERALGGDRRG